MRGWNAWYHISGHTYGSWLPGDPRGWRSRHHRVHCEGDYRNPPPPGTHDSLHARSKHLMPRAAVRLSDEARGIVRDVMAQTLLLYELQPLAIAIDSHHYHILARFPDHRPRKWVGIAKSRTARALSDAGCVAPGGVWAVRCKVTPIDDRRHQIRTFRYILRHAKYGAVTWSFMPEACS